MTTVAFDGKTLASDSKATQQNITMIGPATKIFWPGEGEYWDVMGVKIVAFGMAGDYDMLPFLKEVLSEGLTHRTVFDYDDVNFASILIDENGNAWMYAIHRTQDGRKNTTVFTPSQGPCAVGSGQIVANAVMSIGKSAEAAVKAACKLDIYTGGDVVVWQVPPKPEVPSVRPVKPEEQPLFTKAEVKEILDDAIAKVKERLAPPQPPVTESSAAAPEKVQA